MIDKPDSPLVNGLHASPNFGVRRSAAARRIRGGNDLPDMLIMHYTGMHSCAKAIKWLAQPQSNVSCHYVVDEDGAITQMVAESARAWHAGAGFWAGERDINSLSIGIEVHNRGHELGYPDFPEAQMAAVEALAGDIIERHAIPAWRVLAHSDVAPQRKGDPGEKFPWARMAESGVGFWIPPLPVDEDDAGVGFCADGPAKTAAGICQDPTADEVKRVGEAQRLLARLGYDVEQNAVFDLALHKTVLAFQRHYRPSRCDGRIDASTLGTLRQLVAALASASQPR